MPVPFNRDRDRLANTHCMASAVSQDGRDDAAVRETGSNVESPSTRILTLLERNAAMLEPMNPDAVSGL